MCRLEEQKKKKAATKDDRHGKNDEEQKSERHNGRIKTVGRSVHGWRLIVKKAWLLSEWENVVQQGYDPLRPVLLRPIPT